MCRYEGGSSKGLFPWGHNVSMLWGALPDQLAETACAYFHLWRNGRRAESESVFVSAANGVGSSPAGWAISGLDGLL